MERRLLLNNNTIIGKGEIGDAVFWDGGGGLKQ